MSEEKSKKITSSLPSLSLRESSVVEEIIKPIVQRAGYELVKVELKFQGRNQILEITINKVGGVSIEDCAKVSSLIEPILDEKDLIKGKYLLVVSSPGI